MPGVVFSGGELREVQLEGEDRPSLSRWAYESLSGTNWLAQPVPSTYEAIWRSQPAVRTVTHYLARNMAQLGLHVFQGADSGRVRLRAKDHPFGATIEQPNPSTRLTQYRLIDSLINDLALYDRAYWLKQWDASGVIRLLRLPPRYVWASEGDIVTGVTQFTYNGPNGRLQIPADQMVWFRGYSPDYAGGESPIEALRQILYEDYEAWRFRGDMWRRGARIGGVIERPMDAPEWSEALRDRFKADWQQRYGGNGPEAGGTPVLEDGMSWKNVGAFTPEDAQFLDTHKLSASTVAAAYQVPAALVVAGADAANFAVVRELHQSVYQDTLGPWAAQLEGEILAQLGPDYNLPPDIYVEFNIQEKLQGSFEQQAAAIQSSVGGPWMTRAEARQRMNLTYIEGTEDLIVPLNVTEGGLAAPNDTAPGSGDGPGRQQSARRVLGVIRRTGEPQRKADDQKTTEQRRDELAAALSAFLAKQGSDVHDALAAGQQLSEAWSDGQWTDSMAALILEHTMGIASTAATSLLAEMESSIDFKTDPMTAYLQRSASSTANAVQLAAYHQLADAEGSESSAEEQVSDVFDGLQVDKYAQTLTTDAVGLGQHDAAKAAGRTTKTWNVHSERPRPTHAEMDGETVPIGSVFSNGGRWPGDHQLDESERAGCTCRLTYGDEEAQQP